MVFSQSLTQHVLILFFKTWFTLADQDDKMYIVLEPCHMIKLIRNALQALRCLIVEESFIIRPESILFVYFCKTIINNK